MTPAKLSIFKLINLLIIKVFCLSLFFCFPTVQGLSNNNQISQKTKVKKIKMANDAGLKQYPAEVFAALPDQFLENKIKSTQQAFEERSLLFLRGRPFQSWSLNKPEKDILKEFEQINDWRFNSWYTDYKAKILVARTEFMIAQDLLEKGLYRNSNIIAFQYNQTDETYNSSTIVLNGMRFLALEAPTAKTLNLFNILLQNHQVSQLVRLTPAQQNGKEKSYPYWQGRLSREVNTNEMLFNVTQAGSKNVYSIYYYGVDDWQDDEGYDPKLLLKLVQNVRKQYDESQLLAVHCSSGAGRTGTFIAAMILLSEIDKQIAKHPKDHTLNISIEKIVMQLSLQRPYMVRTAKEYISLYRLVDLYLSTLKKED